MTTAYNYFLGKGYTIINIPYKQLEMNPDMPAALQENFYEIERLLSAMQGDINYLSQYGLDAGDVTSGTFLISPDHAHLIMFAKNKHLFIDMWGLNPDFIKRYNNVVPNSGFEWYDPSTLVPRDWAGDGVVDLSEKWEGKASLKLTPGQTMQMAAGVDPVIWGEKQARVSFRHKGGAVRVKAIYGSGDRELLSSGTKVVQGYSGTTNARISNFVATSDGRHMCAWTDSSKKIILGYCDDESYLTANYAVTSTVDTGLTVGVTGPGQVALYRTDAGKIWLIVSDPVVSGANVKIYVSNTGNGGDFALYSTVLSLAANGGDLRPQYVVNIPIKTTTGRYVLTFGNVYRYSSSDNVGRVYVVTSDNEGANWTVRFTRGTVATGNVTIGQPAQLPNGDLYVESTSGGGDSLVYKSTNDGGSWVNVANFESAFSDASRSNSWMGSYFYDAASAMFYRISVGTSNGCGVYVLPEIDFSSFADKTKWRYILDINSNQGFNHNAKIYLTTSGKLAVSWPDTTSRTVIVGYDVASGAYTLYDNSTDEGTGVAVINQQGAYLDYATTTDWVYETPPALSAIRTPAQNLAQGYHTFYFIPEAGGGAVTLHFENIDPLSPCYIDAVQMEPDFMLKWPGIYNPGPDSTPPELHADTHTTGGADEVTPASIGAETPAGAQGKANTAESNANAYTDLKEFIDLPDTPANYTGQAGKAVLVKALEDGLEFGNIEALPDYLPIIDTPTHKGIARYSDYPANTVLAALFGIKRNEPSVYKEDSQADFEPGELANVGAVAAGLELLNVVADDDFGGQTLNTTPSGWTVSEPGSSTVRIVNFGTGQAAHIIDAANADLPSMTKTVRSTKKGYIEVKCQPAQNNAYFLIFVRDSVNNKYFALFFWNNGTFLYQKLKNDGSYDSNAVLPTATSYVAHTLYTVRIRWDFSVSTGFTVSINGSVRGTNLNGNVLNFANVDTIVIEGDALSSGALTVDDVFLLDEGAPPHGNRIALPQGLTSLGTDPGLEIRWTSTEPTGTDIVIETAVKGETVHTGEAVGTGNGSNNTFYLDYYPAERHTDVVIKVDGTATTEFTRNDTKDPRKIVFNAGHIPGSGLAVTADYTGVDTPSETAEVQELSLGGATGGTFTLGNGTVNTSALAYNSTATQIRTALEAIFGTGLVTVVATTGFTIAFSVRVRASGLVANFAGLTGATSPTLTKTISYSAGDWAEQVTATAISNIPAGSLVGQHLWIRATEETTDTTVTPTLEKLEVYYGTEEFNFFTVDGTVGTL